MPFIAKSSDFDCDVRQTARGFLNAQWNYALLDLYDFMHL